MWEALHQHIERLRQRFGAYPFLVERRARTDTSQLNGKEGQEVAAKKTNPQPWVFKLSDFCVVGDFVAEDAKRRTGTGGACAEGHITPNLCTGFEWRSEN
jgi:hypothetical protein